MVYLDSRAAAQKPNAVIDAMSHAMRHSYANVHRGLHRLANETTDAYEAGRETVARFIKADVNEIVFTKSATEAMNLIASSFGDCLKPGDVVLTTEMEHHANLDPWRRLALERGVTILTVRMDTATGKLNWEDLERFVGPKTKLLAIGAASNALGTINDFKTAIDMAHNAGALVFLDAVNYAPHALIDVAELDCDFLGMSAYKFYGPHVGVLYAKRS